MDKIAKAPTERYYTETYFQHLTYSHIMQTD